MIVVRTADSRYFDEAYFVLRREFGSGHGKRNDMLTEANRIIEQHDSDAGQHHKKRLGRALLFFLCGLLCGGAMAVLICLLAM